MGAAGGAILQRKKPHDLCTARDAGNFLALWQQHAGIDLLSWLAEKFELTADTEVVLAGSIPLGLGTPVSDLDLFLIPSSDHEPKPHEGLEGIVLMPATGESLTRLELIDLAEGVEVDIQVLDRSRLERIVRAIASGSVLLGTEEYTTIGRLCTGWALGRKSSLDNRDGFDRSMFFVYASTREFVVALKHYEDAVAAGTDNSFLSVKMARLAIERCFQAFFCANSLPGLGEKWLRMYAPGARRPDTLDSPVFDRMCAEAIPLLMDAPKPVDEAMREYLSKVERFLSATRSLIERDRKYKIAFSVCRQIG